MKPQDDIIEPVLPRDLLPPALAPADAAAWALKREQIMARLDAAAPATVPQDAGWLTTLGAWWKPAAAVAAAAVLLVSVTDLQADAGRDALPLRVVAAQGEPASLWEGLGAAADPVLALIVAEQPARGR